MPNYNKILKSAATYGTNKNYVDSKTSSSTSPLTTKGDGYTFSTSGARLPVGSNGQVLQADSTEATGLKWVTSTSSNYYADSLSFNTGNGVLTIGRTSPLADLTVDLDGRYITSGIAGSITDNQVAVGASTSNSIEGSANLTYTSTGLKVGSSSATGEYIFVERDSTDTTYDTFYGKAKYPRITLEDTQASATQAIWHLGNQMRFGTNAGSSTTAAMYIQSGQPSDGLAYAKVVMNSAVLAGTDNPINSSRVSIVDTTRPLVLGYDGSNYTDFEISSAGGLTVDSPHTINLDAARHFEIRAGAGRDTRFIYNGTERAVIRENNDGIPFAMMGINITTPDAPLHILKAAGGANIVTALKLDPDDATTNSGVSIDFNASTTNTGASLGGSRIIGAR